MGWKEDEVRSKNIERREVWLAFHGYGLGDMKKDQCLLDEWYGLESNIKNREKKERIMDKCECCGKSRRGIQKVTVRAHLNNFKLCGRCCNGLWISKNIFYSILSKGVDWEHLLEHGKNLVSKGLMW